MPIEVYGKHVLTFTSLDPARELCASDKPLEAKLRKYDLIHYAATATNGGYHATSRDKSEIQKAVLGIFCGYNEDFRCCTTSAASRRTA